MILSGWGNYPKIYSSVVKPLNREALAEVVKPGDVIARGNGRAYGDSAINPATTIDMKGFHRFHDFSSETGLLTVDAGVKLCEIVDIFVPRGWFLPVTPGTSYVTVGGAIASDVHGKNHHIDGTFGQHVTQITLMLGSGEIVEISPQENADLFHATCGGMGLTGIILNATFRMIPIRSSMIRQTMVKLHGLESICEQFERHSDKVYSVAWMDLLAKGKDFGRSIFMFGDHAESGGLSVKSGELLSVPMNAPGFMLNDLGMKAFNSLYYSRAKAGVSEMITIPQYFYPLDRLGNWNKLYGASGFVQYQFVVPKQDGLRNIKLVLDKIAAAGFGPYLVVFKLFGQRNDNLLSFPISGYTLAIDFRMSGHLPGFLRQLDEIIVDMGGRLYLAKDALMTPAMFKKSYPNWEKFETIREAYGAKGKFYSVQSKRLGLA